MLYECLNFLYEIKRKKRRVVLEVQREITLKKRVESGSPSHASHIRVIYDSLRAVTLKQ